MLGVVGVVGREGVGVVGMAMASWAIMVGGRGYERPEAFTLLQEKLVD